MKKIFCIIFFISSFALHSQNPLPTKDKISSSTNGYLNVKEEVAVFPGGISAFRKKIAENFREKKVKGKGRIQSMVTFVVERDGTLSNIQATGENASFNKEAVRAVSLIKQKWTPAKLDNVLVRYRFRVPLTLSF